MGEIKGVTSGTGFSGLFSDEAAIGDPQLSGFSHKPIARWTDIPYQVFREGDSEQTFDPNHLYFGIMAYHSEAIKEVEFFLNGGDGVKVTEQELNPYTDLPEYCVKINKADVITPNGSDNEKFSNLDLRAVVRPNTGVPRMMQHDLDLVKGADAELLIANPFGYSGGKGHYFHDRRSVPGEHSMVATVLKGINNSSIKSFTVYMHPDGSDTNDGTRDNPLKTIGAALKKLRNHRIDDNDPSRFFTSPVLQGRANDNTRFSYVDISGDRIVLLAGDRDPNDPKAHAYTSDNFGVAECVMDGADGAPVGLNDQNPTVGDSDTNKWFVSVKHGWFIVTGDPEEDRENIELTLTQDQAKLQPDGDSLENAFSNLSSDFGIIPSNPAISAVKLEHVFINRDIPKPGFTNWGIRNRDRAGSGQIAGNTSDIDCVWMHDLTVKTKSKGLHATATFTKAQRNPAGAGVIMSGTPTKRSTMTGGDDLMVGVCWTRSTDMAKVNGDQFKTWTFSVDNSVKYNSGGVGQHTWLWFDPIDNPELARKYNGFYTSVRNRGKQGDEPGSLNNYLRIQNEKSPAGITYSWPKQGKKTTDPTQESSAGNLTDTGTIFQKVNHSNFLDLNIPWFIEPDSATDFSTTTYREIADREMNSGERIWNEIPGLDGSVGDSWFGNPLSFDRQNSMPSGNIKVYPDFYRNHGIAPEKAPRWYYSTKDETEDQTLDVQTDLAREDSGMSIFDPADGELNENHKFFEPVYFTPLKYQNDNLGITTWGHVLFDAREPLDANPNDPDWGTTQDFLFRCTGTTWPSVDFDRSGKLNSLWKYQKSQLFSGTKNNQIDEGRLPHIFAKGFTTDELPLSNRGTASLSEFYADMANGGTTAGVANDSYPVVGYGRRGSRDTKHVDHFQIFGIKSIGTIPMWTNCLTAYNNQIANGKACNASMVKEMKESFKDIAWINNVIANQPIPETDGFDYNPTLFENHLFYNNSMVGYKINFRSAVYGSQRFSRDFDTQTEGPYLESVYGSENPDESGVTFNIDFNLDDNLVMRNNVWDKFANADEYNGMIAQGMSGGDPTTGLTWPYKPGVTLPVKMEKNYLWEGTPWQTSLGDNFGWSIITSRNGPGPKYTRALPIVGGNDLTPNDLANITNPFLGNFLYQPTEGSCWIGGSTLGTDKHVPFDLNRNRRYDRVTAGAYEPISSTLVHKSNYVPQGEKFDEDMIEPVHGITLISFEFPELEDRLKLYAKRIKVRATKESSDGTGDIQERFSEDILRFERNTEGDFGQENPDSNPPSGDGGDGGGGAQEELNSYAFILTEDNFGGAVVQQSRHISLEDADDSDDDGEPDDPETPDTWLHRDYGVKRIDIFGPDSTFAGHTANSVILTFEDSTGSSETANARANSFYDAYKVEGITIEFGFKRATGQTRLRELLGPDASQSLSGATVSGADYVSYFTDQLATGAAGTSYSNTNPSDGDGILDRGALMPQSNIIINKPSGL